MITVALRFSEKFAPPEGTVVAHEQIIAKHGFVWYGKMGTPLSAKVCASIMENNAPRVLLIQSGGVKRYWAYINAISHEQPDLNLVPSYYHDKVDNVKTWFSITSFERAPKSVMSECKVCSSGATLSLTSQHSMSPYFIISIDA